MNTPAPLPPRSSTRYPSNSDSRPGDSQPNERTGADRGRPGESTASNGGGPDDLREHAHREQHTHRDPAYGEPILFGLDKFGLIVVSLALTVFVGFMVSLVLIYRPSSTAHPAPPLPSTTAASEPSPTASPTPTLSPELAAQRDAAYAMAPPEENPQMFTNTDEGGAATADYFMRTTVYGFITGDSSLTEAISDPECQFCASVRQGADKLREEGSWYAPYDVTLSPITWTPPTETVPYGFAQFDITLDERTMYDAHGQSESFDAVTETIELGMYWNGERWIVRGGVLPE